MIHLLDRSLKGPGVDVEGQDYNWGAGALQVTKASQRFVVRASAEQNVDVEAVVKDLQEKVSARGKASSN